MSEGSGNPKLCPSSRAESGNLLFGRVVDGAIERLGTPLAVDGAFLDAVREFGSPEQRFRFAGRCQEGACAQWTGTGCGVIERVLADVRPPDDGTAPAAALPRCALRARCRWYVQEGAAACGACAHVVTDARSR